MEGDYTGEEWTTLRAVDLGCIFWAAKRRDTALSHMYRPIDFYHVHCKMARAPMMLTHNIAYSLQSPTVRRGWVSSIALLWPLDAGRPREQGPGAKQSKTCLRLTAELSP